MGRSAMTAPMVGGVILVVIGLLGFAVPYFTTSQTKDVAAIGDLKLQTTESKSSRSRRWLAAARCCLVSS
jgi:hypothetical protein